MSGNSKYLCTECGWAAKGECPRHPGASLNMGKHWRPGKKGRRTRLWDNRVHGSVTVPAETGRKGRRIWRARPFAERQHTPSGLIALGATDFSHDKSDLPWNDPVRAAIRAKNARPPRPLRVPGWKPVPGWPFPFNWQKGEHEVPDRYRL